MATGLVAGAAVWLFGGQPIIGVLLFLAMIIDLFVAGAAGSSSRWGLKALKVDPALASTVFITTFTDVAGFASFLGLAALYLRTTHH